jgi:dTDP-4-amino-4,6-dideoxygalactose transaminase
MKTATALGGAVALIRHDKLRQRMSEIERSYPVHAQRLFLRRTLLFSLAHLCSHPWIYGGFVGLLERRGVDLDDFLARSVLRAFYTGDFWDKLRRRPPAAMLRLLEHRLQFPDHRTVERRRTLAKRLVQTIGEERVPGSASPDHVHWVVPVVSRDPRRLIATLKREGYDASRAVSSLVVIDPPPDRPAQDATHARNLMGQIVYLPFDYRMTLEKVDRLGDLVARHESQFDSVSSHVSSERVDHRPATYPAVPGT